MALFGGSDESLNVTIKAKDEASAELNKVQLSVGRLATGFALGTIAVQAFQTGFRFLSGIVTNSIREFEEYNQAVAQTNAVLQSTQHAAGLTSKEVIDLSKSLSENALYQDDMVLSAENMLLTFTNITKDIFPETTQAVLDMSTAIGQDLSSSAIQLGKALNNPIEGVSALQRVGVSFNNAQQEQIATMVKAGRTMDAQRYILAELRKEFGGSAASAYESASSVTKLEKNIKDLEQSIGAGLTPALNNLFSAYQDTTKGTAEYNDKALVAFTITSKLAEIATAAAVGFGAIGTALIDTATIMAQFTLHSTGLSTALKAFGYDSDKHLSGVRDDFNDGLSSAVSFYDVLKDRNEGVINSWDQVNVEAKALGKAGPAAYQATAAEAKKAADQIKKTQQAIADTKKTLDDYRKDLAGETTNVAELFVEQEKTVHEAALKVQEARKALSDASDKLVKKPNDKDQQETVATATADYNAALAELKKQNDALSSASTIRQQLPTQVANAERRANETEFERNLEDIFLRVNEKGQNFAQGITYQINFGDAVVGDEGIKRVITEAINAVNRQAALQSAGR